MGSKFITRPRLAGQLLSMGYSGKQVPNPYSPDRPAWEFEESEALNQVVKDYLSARKTEGKQ